MYSNTKPGQVINITISTLVFTKLCC